MKKLITLLFILFSLNSSYAQIYGHAIKFADGDTFTFLSTEGDTFKIRLQGIDCPEKKQEYGATAAQFTKEFLNGQLLFVYIKDTDYYGRRIAVVYNQIYKQSLNEALLRNGLAWHYTQYDKNPSYSNFEYFARIKKVNIWSSPNPVAPWEYRKAKKTK